MQEVRGSCSGFHVARLMVGMCCVIRLLGLDLTGLSAFFLGGPVMRLCSWRGGFPESWVPGDGVVGASCPALSCPAILWRNVSLACLWQSVRCWGWGWGPVRDGAPGCQVRLECPLTHTLIQEQYAWVSLPRRAAFPLPSRLPSSEPSEW